MLYKGEGTADLDSCIYYATKIIEHGYYALESDYRKLFSHPMGDYSNGNSHELILSCVYGPMLIMVVTVIVYLISLVVITRIHPGGFLISVWEYPTKSSTRVGFTNDFGFDLYVNKQADSRYEKSFYMEYTTNG